MQRIQRFANEITRYKIKRSEHFLLFGYSDVAFMCVASGLRGVANAMALAAVHDAKFKEFIKQINQAIDDYEKGKEDGDRGGNS